MTEKFKITPVEETDESITLQVSRAAGETLIVKFTPPDKVSFELGAGESRADRETEPQEITIEGRVAKNSGEFGGAKYDREKHTFSVRIAHQYNPGNQKEA